MMASDVRPTLQHFNVQNIIICFLSHEANKNHKSSQLDKQKLGNVCFLLKKKKILKWFHRLDNRPEPLEFLWQYKVQRRKRGSWRTSCTQLYRPHYIQLHFIPNTFVLFLLHTEIYRPKQSRHSAHAHLFGHS